MADAPRPTTYAALAWTADDVQTLRDDWTVEQAEAFLSRNEKYLRDRLTELGWDVLETLISCDEEA